MRDSKSGTGPIRSQSTRQRKNPSRSPSAYTGEYSSSRRVVVYLRRLGSHEVTALSQRSADTSKALNEAPYTHGCLHKTH